MGLFKEIVDFIDRPLNISTGNMGATTLNEKSQNERSREFIDSVQDGNELLFRLAASGYFDQKIDLSFVQGVSTYKSILLASGITSILLALIMTPLDLIVFNQM